jgi:hypothetical protein
VSRRLDQAEIVLPDALDLSERLDHKRSTAQAHMFCAETFIVLDKPENAGQHPKDAASAAASATVDVGDRRRGRVYSVSRTSSRLGT